MRYKIKKKKRLPALKGLGSIMWMFRFLNDIPFWEGIRSAFVSGMAIFIDCCFGC